MDEIELTFLHTAYNDLKDMTIETLMKVLLEVSTEIARRENIEAR